MKCPKCGAENKEKAVICFSCGESLLPNSILRRQFYTGDPYPENLPIVKLISLFWGRVRRKPAELVVVLAAVCFVAYVLLMSVLNFKYPVRHNEKVLNAKIEELIKENDDLKISSARIISYQPKLSLPEIQYLKGKGLKDPVNDVISDLMKHNELIPYQGVLGGKMGFYSKENICVVSTELVRASFDDGHKEGWMLLEYEVTGENEISWKVLESYLD